MAFNSRSSQRRKLIIDALNSRGHHRTINDHIKGAQMNDNQILLYETEDGETRVEVLHQDETLWLSQRDMAELFKSYVRINIGIHIKNIYETGRACIPIQLERIIYEFKSKAGARFRER